jgi:hypothetical protein
MTVASFFRKYSVGCILNYVRLIITREISCIYRVSQNWLPRENMHVPTTKETPN